MRDGYGVQKWPDGAKYEGVYILNQLKKNYSNKS